MKIYRVAKRGFIDDLSGEGARLYGGRWNREGDAVLYFSEHLSLCVLELLARIDYEFIQTQYWFLEADVSVKFFTHLSKPEEISKDWRQNPHISATQDYGSQWLRKCENLGLWVSSAVLPAENNILVNPQHISFSSLKILRTEPLDLDNRFVD